MTNENYTVDILVNDKPIRKYPHNGKLFVESRSGDTYSIRIKNNSYNRILAVTSVDGLDTLTGKSATEDGNGYVINGYNSLTIDGFRVSNEKVAKFLFDYKGGSYAASKEDGSERNVGVIGIRLFAEKVQPLPPPPIVLGEEHHHHHHNLYPKYPWSNPWYDNSPIIWCGGLSQGATSNATFGSTLDYCAGTTDACCCGDTDAEGPSKYSADISRYRSTSKGGQQAANSILHEMSMKCSAPSAPNADPLGFDMGTKFGEAKESRVIEVEFEKGVLALATNIYYASRQSLVEMGVPLGCEKQVSFPDPFNGTKYATPPVGWNG